MKDLVVLVPSRGRPRSITRLWDAMTGTCQGDTTLVVGLDEDDPAREEYPDLPPRPGLGGEYVVRAGLRGVVAWLNELAVPRAGEYRFTGTLGDDNLPRTPGWDVRIMEALERTPFAFGNDLYPREPGTLCCHIFCRSEVVRALGYLGPPRFRHMFVDPVWMEWGKAAGITYLHEVILEHLHFTNGKSPADETYAAAVAQWLPDEAAYDAYLTDPDGLQADIARIRAVL